MLLTITHSKLIHAIINILAYSGQKLLAKPKCHLLNYKDFQIRIAAPTALLLQRFFFRYGTE